MVDKTSVTIIAFIVVFGMSAALLATGAVPKVFDMINVANQTKYESINQTDILQKFVTLYLANTKNDTKEALQALASAKESIVNQERLMSENKESITNQEKILNENRNITKDILEISREHKSVAHSHDLLQKRGDDLIEKIDNITQLSFELLERHAKNVSKAQERTEEVINQSGR